MGILTCALNHHFRLIKLDTKIPVQYNKKDFIPNKRGLYEYIF